MTADTARSAHLAQRREMSAGQRRQLIIERSAELFDSGSYTSTSMDDIAEAVGVAKPTLYHYFKSKAEILFEIHEALIQQLLERYGGERTGTAAEQLLSIMEQILAFMQSRPGHMRVFFEHYRELPEQEREIIRSKRERFQSIVEEVLADGVRSGDFRPMDVRLTSFQIFGACIWAYQWYVPGGRAQPEEIARLFWTQFMDGIGMHRADTNGWAGRGPVVGEPARTGSADQSSRKKPARKRTGSEPS